MDTCSQCGKLLYGGSDVCPWCGKPVLASPAVSPPAIPAPPPQAVPEPAATTPLMATPAPGLPRVAVSVVRRSPPAPLPGPLDLRVDPGPFAGRAPWWRIGFGVLLLASALVRLLAIHPSTTSSGASLSTSFGSPIPLVSPSHHSDPIVLPAVLSAPPPTTLTAAQAEAITQAWWPLDEQARATNDQETFDLLETGPSRRYSDAATADSLTLGGNPRTARPLNDISILLGPPSAGPPVFLAQVFTTRYGDSSPYAELLTFTHTEGRWQVAIDAGAGFNTFPPYAPGPPLPQSGPYPPQSVANGLADWRTRYLAAGHDPGMGYPFQPGPWTTDLMATILKVHNATAGSGVVEETTYSADLGTGSLYRFAESRGELACYTEAATTEASIPGQKVTQYGNLRNWGVRVRPGHYSSLTFHGIRETCLNLPRSAGAVIQVTANNYQEVGAETH